MSSTKSNQTYTDDAKVYLCVNDTIAGGGAISRRFVNSVVSSYIDNDKYDTAIWKGWRILMSISF